MAALRQIAFYGKGGTGKPKRKPKQKPKKTPKKTPKKKLGAIEIQTLQRAV
ncbi:hypothetical protein [Sinorhizobium meliloti]|uniref:hypothetical protein n=1 Tax=Rhizobium meliloti TaxID=382 RepID=UPI0002FC48E2|nr:hypothetical protein [Sinorhizobium meliloti]MDE3766279.1 hypothetical protein [Sinorhizobium meliloti]MDE3781094.1 hypothetical protein [Sinorhizobium meliloti]MDE3784307.1 hypothetical protein [Sinorhizobium meliloti]MDE3804141.1 hypothetical protein [Sinorhizobium meliloti]MDE4595969.1 hypothetical protein [Sinorhizobium meliloti]